MRMCGCVCVCVCVCVKERERERESERKREREVVLGGRLGLLGEVEAREETVCHEPHHLMSCPLSGDAPSFSSFRFFELPT